MRQPILYILAGLPGSGKTTLSELLASKVGAARVVDAAGKSAAECLETLLTDLSGIGSLTVVRQP